MTFWIVSGGTAAAVALLLALALRSSRRAQDMPAAAYDLRVYRDQLREVEKDVLRGIVNEADAERIKAEISRRILAADAAVTLEIQATARSPGAPKLTAALVALALVGGSLGLYSVLGAPGYGDLALANRIDMAEAARDTRPDQRRAEAGLPDYVPPAEVDPEYLALVERLRTAVADRPDDLQGHVLLAQNEANLGNFRAAARAQEQVLHIKGADATVRDHIDYADTLVLAAGGYVSPEAEAALNRVLAQDPGNGAARYYMALMLAQTGRPDSAFRIWDQLLRAGPEDAPWIAPILAQIEDMAYRAGVNYQLPEIGAGSSLRGPSAADLQAAEDLSPADRMEMIQSMVEGLSDRLATQGGPVQEWAQLITALGVLGQTGQARAVYENAIDVFADDTRALDMLLRAGRRAQVAQ
ncbi:MAG: c-type cytochrome biogenesis protein CcmI [Pseudomonadota bacterium]